MNRLFSQHYIDITQLHLHTLMLHTYCANAKTKAIHHGIAIKLCLAFNCSARSKAL